MAFNKENYTAIANYIDVHGDRNSEIKFNPQNPQCAGPCGNFVFDVIANSTQKNITNFREYINTLPLETIPSEFEQVSNYNDFLSLTAGSVLAVHRRGGYRTFMIHFMIKYKANMVFGVNHGGRIGERSSGHLLRFSEIYNGDFNSGLFMYEIPVIERGIAPIFRLFHFKDIILG